MVTLLVTPEDAEKMALAAEEGQIMLTLRNPLDVQPTETSGVKMAGLMTRPGASARREEGGGPQGRCVGEAPRAPPPPPKTYTVEAIRAAKRTEEPIK